MPLSPKQLYDLFHEMALEKDFFFRGATAGGAGLTQALSQGFSVGFSPYKARDDRRFPAAW